MRTILTLLNTMIQSGQLLVLTKYWHNLMIQLQLLFSMRELALVITHFNCARALVTWLLLRLTMACSLK